jgi:hypothetical protein
MTETPDPPVIVVFGAGTRMWIQLSTAATDQVHVGAVWSVKIRLLKPEPENGVGTPEVGGKL